LVGINVPRVRTGGASRLIGFIHDTLARDKHRVDYLCSEDVPKSLKGGLARFYFPALIFKRALAKARGGMPYDIINVHEPSGVVVILGRRALGNPKIVVTSFGVEGRGWNTTLEDMRLGRVQLGTKTRIVYPLTNLWQSAVSLRRADHIFCSNSEDRDYLVDRFHREPKDVTRIFSGADAVYAAATADRDYREPRRLLFAGTWIARKGTQDVREAFTRLGTYHSELTLTVLGAGVPPEVVVGSFPANLRGRIECVKANSDAEAASVFANCDLFVLPSLFEGTPLTLIEAMMSGLPIVTTATCGMKDVIRDNENGLLVPIRSPEALASAIGRLVENKGLRETFGRAAQRDALTKYTWEQVSRPVRDVYEDLSINRTTSNPLFAGGAREN
jgi:glycosyltransferase involved in cell wall biosynthesis